MTNVAPAYDEPHNQKVYSNTARTRLDCLKPTTNGYRRVSA